MDWLMESGYQAEDANDMQMTLSILIPSLSQTWPLPTFLASAPGSWGPGRLEGIVQLDTIILSVRRGRDQENTARSLERRRGAMAHRAPSISDPKRPNCRRYVQSYIRDCFGTQDLHLDSVWR